MESGVLIRKYKVGHQVYGETCRSFSITVPMTWLRDRSVEVGDEIGVYQKPNDDRLYLEKIER